MTEQWRPIAGYENVYEISDLGRVKSLRQGGTIRATSLDKDGYPRIGLQGRTVRIHNLVCTAFHGPRPDGFEVGHRNGIKTDARASNLEWITRSENNRDRKRHGLPCLPPRNPKGEKHPQAKYSDAVIAALRADAATGIGPRRLARKYGMGHAYAYRLIKGLNRTEGQAPDPLRPDTLTKAGGPSDA